MNNWVLFVSSILLLFIIQLLRMARKRTAELESEVEAHRQTEQELQSLFMAAPMAVAYVKDRVFVKVNDAMCNMYGYSRDELIGQSARMLYVTETDFIAAGSQTYTKAMGNGSAMIETRTIAKQGEFIDILLGVAPLDRGKVLSGFVTMALDITARIKAVAALEESERRFQTIFDESPMIMALYDIQTGAYINLNRRCCEFHGITMETSIGKRPYEVGVLHKEEFQRVYDKFTANGILEQEEVKCLDKNDESLHMLVSAKIIAISGKQYAITVSHDITARKVAEEENELLMDQLLQAQKIESIGRLAGGIAHDFNNLLTPILGYSELLKRTMSAGNSESDMIDNIIKAADRAKILTQQLLSFSRKQILEMNTIDLSKVVTSFYGILRRTIRENIEIKLNLTGDSIGVKADRNQIEQVIMNLVVNAQDAIKDRGIITIDTALIIIDEEYARQHSLLKPGSYFMLVVTDTGCGMDKETLAHIYEPFFTTKVLGEGTGLGLATVYGIVKQHEGYVVAQCEVGAGCVFKLYFPVVEEQPFECLESDSEPIRPDSEGRTILLVEDNKMVRKLVYDFLIEQGFKVFEEESPKKAIMVCESKKPDLLITDVVMPEMNGPELYQQLLKKHQDLKVLYMSGYANNLIAHHGVLDKGINFIQKPFKAFDLSHKIQNILSEGVPCT
jgi:PAS domain S-box-containing protein